MICYEYINEYIRKTIKKTDGILAEMELYAKENHVPIVHPEVARFLSVIGNIKKPKRILEVGTAIGYSAIVMSSFLERDGNIDTIERHEIVFQKAKEYVKRAGLSEKINLIQGEAKEILTSINEKYDMVFVDAAKGQYLEFLPDILRVINNGGIIVSDNVLYKGMIATDELVVRRKKTIVKRMREYLNVICNHEQLDTSIIPIGDGVAISYKND